MQIKITFRNETKKVRKATDYDNLVVQAKKSFGELPLNFKFFYLDSEGDMISITNQDDLEEAISCMEDQQTLKLILEESIEAARQMIDAQGNSFGDSIKFAGGLKPNQQVEDMDNSALGGLAPPKAAMVSAQNTMTMEQSSSDQEGKELPPQFSQLDKNTQQEMVQNLDFQEAKSDYNMSEENKDADIDVHDLDEVKREVYDGSEEEDRFAENLNNAANLRRNSTELIRRGTEIVRQDSDDDIEFQREFEATQAEEERLRKEEEERKREEEERLRLEELERIRLEEEERLRLQEEERRRIEEEEKRKAEEERRRLEEEARLKLEEEQRLEQERVRQEQEKQRLDEEERLRQEAEEKRLQEERQREMLLAQEEEQRRLAEEHKLKQAEEEARLAQLEKEKRTQQLYDEEVKLALKEEIIDRSKITCFNCEGTTKNKSGRPCKKCHETGFIQSKFMYEILKVIQEEVNAYTPSTFQKLMDKQGKVEVVPDVEHKGVKCFKCGVAPIMGARFRCFQCENVNLCEVCEKIPDSHASIHAMVKIRRPELDPFKVNQSIYFSSIPHQQNVQAEEKEEKKEERKAVEQQMVHTSIMESRIDQSVNISSMRRASTKRVYKARFIKESFAENFTVEQGNKFEKVWTFRNDGAESWPADTRFIYTNGEQFGALEKKIEKEVKPGDYVDVSLECQAPARTGKYCAFYRFTHGNNERFGQKVWCDILVVEKENEIAKLQRDMIGDPKLHPMYNPQSNPIAPPKPMPVVQAQPQGFVPPNMQPQPQPLVKPIQGPPPVQPQQPMVQQPQMQQPLGQPIQQHPMQPPLQHPMQPYPGQQPPPYIPQPVYNPPPQPQYLPPPQGQYPEINQPYQQPQQLKSSLLGDENMSREDKDKIEYISYVDNMLSKQFRDSMLFLLEMGFTDFRKNEKLLEKHKGSMQAVTNELALGM